MRSEDLCREISETVINTDGKAFNITVSIGLSELLAYAHRSESIRQADLALYEAKRAGKNCVKVADYEYD